MAVGPFSGNDSIKIGTNPHRGTNVINKRLKMMAVGCPASRFPVPEEVSHGPNPPTPYCIRQPTSAPRSPILSKNSGI